jgi:hypothetical protein
MAEAAPPAPPPPSATVADIIWGEFQGLMKWLETSSFRNLAGLLRQFDAGEDEKQKAEGDPQGRLLVLLYSLRGAGAETLKDVEIAMSQPQHPGAKYLRGVIMRLAATQGTVVTGIINNHLGSLKDEQLLQPKRSHCLYVAQMFRRWVEMLVNKPTA